MRHAKVIGRFGSVFAASIAVVVVLLAVGVAQASASFGFEKLDMTFTGPKGSPEMQAGSHPFAVTTDIMFKVGVNGEGNEVPEEETKDIRVYLPAGLVGDPAATPRCSDAKFAEINPTNKHSECPDSTAVGTIEVFAAAGKVERLATAPVFNLVPPPGAVLKLGFVVSVGGVPVTIDFRVNPNPPYDVIAEPSNISQAVLFAGSNLVLWGDPASPAHDSQRGACAQESEKSCPTNTPETPFITLPTSCEGPLTTLFEADSWQHPGVWVPGEAVTHDGSEPPVPLGMFGCGKLEFSPTIEASPTSEAAQSPTGLDFSLNVADEGLISPKGVAQSEIEKAVVTLPEGMTANPALAEGLAACSEEQLARETASSAPGEGCPQASKVGTLEVKTPLLEEDLEGSLYLATPYKNPFDALLAAYIVIRNPKLGIVIRQPAEIVPDPVTGRLTAVVEDIPQLPFSHFTLHFRQGARSPLATPPACGSYDVSATLYPWSGGAPITTSSMFQIVAGTGGGSCPAGGVPPFKPGLVAGTLNNDAGAYSPLDIEITRNDGEQEITGFSTLMPPGLTARLTGVPFCSEAEIQRAREQTGAQAQASPACPAASRIGHTLVGVGVGPVLAQTPGALYMAGPYQGAPFSVVAVTAAKVGPFDLGTVVVHLPLNIDPLTAQVSIPQGTADQIPHIVDGIVVHVRDIHVYVDRGEFIRNPTSCASMSLQATVYGSGASFASSADDQSSTVTDRFQGADCASLPFKPKFTATTKAKHSRREGAYFRVGVTSSGKAANIKEVHVELPKKLPSELKTLQKACSQKQFEADPAGCPAESVVGYAKALTPILPVPLEGPAYFVSFGAAKYPELVIALHGYGVTIDLHGETFISKSGVTSSTFKTVPDQPVESFELTLPMSDHPALTMTTNFCKHPQVMPTRIVSQSGKVIERNTKIAVEGCKPAIYVLKHKTHGTRSRIVLRMPSTGKLTVNGKGIHTVTKRLRKHAGLHAITVALTRTLSKRLRGRHHGHVTVEVHLKFEPKHGKTLHSKLKLRFG